MSFFLSLALAQNPSLFLDDYEMIHVSAGTFKMGSPKSEPERGDDEKEHKVTLTHDFWMGKTEMTQAVFENYKKHESKFRGKQLPVENIAFIDVLKFLNAISKSEGLQECYDWSSEVSVWRDGYECTGYRLPTEAEWEFVAQQSYEGSKLDVAWLYENSEKQTHPVGTKKPNNLGFYDMLGNVAEWVWDPHDKYSNQAIDPKGPELKSKDKEFRIRRGGGYTTGEIYARSADRYALNPENKHGFLGFRIVRTVPQIVK